MALSNLSNPSDREIHNMLVVGKVLTSNSKKGEKCDEFVLDILFTHMQSIQSKIRSILSQSGNNTESIDQKYPLSVNTLVTLVREGLEDIELGRRIRDFCGVKRDGPMTITPSQETGEIIPFAKAK